MTMFMVYVGKVYRCMLTLFYGHGKTLWVWANFVGMKFWLTEKFCWVCDVGSWKICVVMILAM